MRGQSTHVNILINAGVDPNKKIKGKSLIDILENKMERVKKINKFMYNKLAKTKRILIKYNKN